MFNLCFFIFELSKFEGSFRSAKPLTPACGKPWQRTFRPGAGRFGSSVGVRFDSALFGRARTGLAVNFLPRSCVGSAAQFPSTGDGRGCGFGSALFGCGILSAGVSGQGWQRTFHALFGRAQTGFAAHFSIGRGSVRQLTFLPQGTRDGRGYGFGSALFSSGMRGMEPRGERPSKNR